MFLCLHKTQWWLYFKINLHLHQAYCTCTVCMYNLSICNWAYVTFYLHRVQHALSSFWQNGCFFSKRHSSNQRKLDCFPVKYTQKIMVKSAVFYWSFSSTFIPKISANFPKNRLFFCKFDSEKPAKFDFFPRPIRCPEILCACSENWV